MKPFAIALSSVVLALSIAACGTTTGPQAPGALRAGTQTASALRQVPADYYKAAEGQQGQALLRTLANVVSKHKDLGYDRARDIMFQTVDDTDNDNVVECDYTGKTLANITGKDAAYKGGKGFNAEHTWPQSKGATGAAKADLHHLFPTDCNANSRRSSFPFGNVSSVKWEEGGSKLGTDSKGRTVFEPRDDQKGNTARAILYFYMVYGNRADLENFRAEETTLKQWHQADPVTAEDLARNNAVYEAQGNRNPFVDRPEFVQAIGSFQGNGFKAPALSVR
ncbi:MAG: endonuclease I family protein [Candidatus Sericytochromatia bacterium]